MQHVDVEKWLKRQTYIVLPQNPTLDGNPNTSIFQTIGISNLLKIGSFLSPALDYYAAHWIKIRNILTAVLNVQLEKI